MPGLEIIEGGAIAAYLTHDGIKRLLGPTADYLGQGLSELTQKRVEAIVAIFKNAESKLGDRISSPGEIPPKVLKTIINDGSFATDQLAIEYLGGILASSRTERGRDDRGARLTKLTDNLSTYQLRAHFIIYSIIHELFMGSTATLAIQEERSRLKIFIPFDSFVRAFDFNAQELSQDAQIFSHIFHGLAADQLIDNNWSFGPKEHLKATYFHLAPEDGIIVTPTALGAELFMWAFGHADKAPDYFFDMAFSPKVDGISINFQGTCKTNSK